MKSLFTLDIKKGNNSKLADAMVGGFRTQYTARSPLFAALEKFQSIYHWNNHSELMGPPLFNKSKNNLTVFFLYPEIFNTG